VRLMDMIQCPPALPRPSTISCRRASNGLREILCDVSLSTQDISPAGRLTGSFIPHCKGQVILDGGSGELGEGFQDFPVRPDELRTGPMDHKQVLKWYKNHSGLEGRYRVINLLDGAGPGVVRAKPSTGRQVISRIWRTRGTNTRPIFSRPFYSWLFFTSPQWIRRSDDP